MFSSSEIVTIAGLPFVSYGVGKVTIEEQQFLAKLGGSAKQKERDALELLMKEFGLADAKEAFYKKKEAILYNMRLVSAIPLDNGSIYTRVNLDEGETIDEVLFQIVNYLEYIDLMEEKDSVEKEVEELTALINFRLDWESFDAEDFLTKTGCKISKKWTVEATKAIWVNYKDLIQFFDSQFKGKTSAS
jgi:hypothetical protein